MNEPRLPVDDVSPFANLLRQAILLKDKIDVQYQNLLRRLTGIHDGNLTMMLDGILKETLSFL